MSNPKKKISELIKKFKKGESDYRKDSYNETLLRRDFLDPLLVSLGWDVDNSKSLPQHLREVIHEDSLEIESKNKKPDYAFRLGSGRKFFLEAKKPSVNILTNKHSSFQARRYGWSANHKIVILSNFKHLLIYDGRVPPKESDPANMCCIKKYSYDEYVEKYDEIASLISRDSVYSGNFDRLQPDATRDQIDIDQFFLEQINHWRILLAKEIYQQKKDIEDNVLNDVIQKFINRIIFLRICEDRDLEKYESLLTIANKNDFKKVIELFEEADKKYNSGLFDVTKDILGVDLTLKNETVIEIVKDLYYPKSPYSFSVIDSGILGEIYELFLSEKIVVEKNNIVLKQKDKRDNRDVVATPKEIVKKIIDDSLPQILSGKDIKQILKLNILDSCCGSGAFLIGAYQYLIDEIREILISNKDKRYVYEGKGNSWFLSFDMKKELLINCLYGVDIDFNAVEVAKFSLLIKLLEDENSNTLKDRTKILPVLDSNIKCGNSLIDSKFFDEYNYDKLSDEELNRINHFDWKDEFEDIMKEGFDLILGNPPYTKSEDMKKQYPIEYEYFKKAYPCSALTQFDMYYLFLDKSTQLLKTGGTLGFIIPNKFMKIKSGLKIRKLLSDQKYVSKIVSFNAIQVFKKKSTYTCVLILNKKKNVEFEYTSVKDYISWLIKDDAPKIKLGCGELNKDKWIILTKEEKALYDHIYSKSIKLENEATPFNGIQTSKNNVFIISAWSDNKKTIIFSKKGKEYEIEKSILKPYFSTDRGGGVYKSFDTLSFNSLVIFPYKIVKGSPILYTNKEMKTNFPLCWDYLNSFKDDLMDRDIQPVPATKNEWYRYGRHQSLTIFNNREKIIVGVLFFSERYVLDSSNILFSSGGTAGYCGIYMNDKSPYSIHYILGLINSGVVEWIAKLIGDVFQGDCYAHGTDVLKRLPIRKIDFKDKKDIKMHNEIVSIVKSIILEKVKLNKTNDKRSITIIKRRIFSLRIKLEKSVLELYKISDTQKVMLK